MKSNKLKIIKKELKEKIDKIISKLKLEQNKFNSIELILIFIRIG